MDDEIIIDFTRLANDYVYAKEVLEMINYDETFLEEAIDMMLEKVNNLLWLKEHIN